MTGLQGMTIGFVGLGSIGQHLADHLHKEGATLRVHNRTDTKQETWLAEHAEAYGASSPGEAAYGADAVITCVSDDQDLKDVYFGGDGILDSLRQNSCVIDHTTASDGIAIELEKRVIAAGSHFVDAPVSGGSAGAQNRTLSIMVGGSPEAFARAQSILNIYGRSVNHIGPAGSGQLCKMVNQVCIAGILEGLAEGLGLAIASGLDTKKVLAAIGGGAAGSWQMNNRASFMLANNYPAGFAAKLMYKDLGLSIASADSRHVNLPVATFVRQRYAKLLERELGDEDFSNLFRLVAEGLAATDFGSGPA